MRQKYFVKPDAIVNVTLYDLVLDELSSVSSPDPLQIVFRIPGKFLGLVKLSCIMMLPISMHNLHLPLVSHEDLSSCCNRSGFALNHQGGGLV